MVWLDGGVCHDCRMPETPERPVLSSGSLNSDPRNLRAEELALEECMRGVEVRRTWSEKQMVCMLGKSVLPGTPDGMFEDWAGGLTCVQVVRVPLVPGSDHESHARVLYATVLTKILKSQCWMRSSHTVPQDFVIFCWLPITPGGLPDSCAVPAEILVSRVKAEGWPFSLRLMVPTEPGELFPAKFAFCSSGVRPIRVSESDLSTFDPSDFLSDDEPPDWDIFADEDDDEVKAEDSAKFQPVTWSGSGDEPVDRGRFTKEKDDALYVVCSIQFKECVLSSKPDTVMDSAQVSNHKCLAPIRTHKAGQGRRYTRRRRRSQVHDRQRTAASIDVGSCVSFAADAVACF